jgi:hypothetical protein
MNEPGTADRDVPAPEDRDGEEAGPGRATRGADSLTQSLETALENGYVDPKDVVPLLASRLSAIECRLASVDRWMNRVKRRVAQMESRLTALSERSSKQDGALWMMYQVLKDLDDPYGFGTSLDERIACDDPDRTEEEGG